MLTKKQYELLLYIHKRLQDSGIPPSFDEMKQALDLASKSGVHRLIKGLEERGFVRRLPNRARALEVIRLPDAMNSSIREKTKIEPFIKKPSSFAKPRLNIEATNSNVNVPIMGRIAAGVPIAAIQQQLKVLSLPSELLGGGEHYALEVKGDSMIDAGIFDGDTVIIKKGDTAIPGEIVVALVDEEEATLKRYRKKGAEIALEAANPAYETRIYEANRIRIQGKLVGLMRVY